MTEATTTSREDRLLARIEQLEAKFHDLEACESIRDVLGRYCRGVDRCDHELLASCYHPDAIDEHGFFKTVGGDEFAEMSVRLASEHFERMFYSLGTIQIKVNGNQATAETYCTSTKVFYELDENGQRQLRLSGVRFLDRFEKRNGEWRIAHRRLVGEWGFFHPLPTKTVGSFKVPHDPATMPPLGVRGHADPSYSL